MNGFRDFHNSTYEDQDSEGSVPQPPAEIVFITSRAE